MRKTTTPLVVVVDEATVVVKAAFVVVDVAVDVAKAVTFSRIFINIDI